MRTYEDVDSFQIASIEPARKEGYCWIDGLPYPAGETIAIVRYGRANDWDKAHVQCAENSPKYKAHADYHISQATVNAIQAEAIRAHIKHSGHTPANMQLTNEQRLVIVVEEVGEVARAMTYDEGDNKQLLHELVQLSTMAAMWIEGIKDE